MGAFPRRPDRGGFRTMVIMPHRVTVSEDCVVLLSGEGEHDRSTVPTSREMTLQEYHADPFCHLKLFNYNVNARIVATRASHNCLLYGLET